MFYLCSFETSALRLREKVFICFAHITYFFLCRWLAAEDIQFMGCPFVHERMLKVCEYDILQIACVDFSKCTN